MMGKKSLLVLTVLGLCIVGFYQANSTLISSNQLDAHSSLSHHQTSNAINGINSIKEKVQQQKQTAATDLSSHNNDTLTGIERLQNLAHKTDLQEQVISEHKNFKRYPPENAAIKSPQQDPISQRYAVDERTTTNDDHTFGLTIWSNEKYYIASDQVNVFAFLQDAQGERTQGNFNAIFQSDNQKSISEFTLKDNDNDGLYEATIDLSQASNSALSPGIYKVIIEENTSQIKDALTFTLSQPDIQLTGEFRDSITSQGDLLIEAQVEIAQDNRFYIQASLYSINQEPVGITQVTQSLSSGKHWLALNFSGLMIQDSLATGPYVLQQISLAKVTMPMQRGPLQQPDYQTDSYGLDEFSNNP
jgi:hypothetical protein